MQIIIEDTAKEKIASMLQEESKSESALRIRITGRNAQGYQHALSLVDPGHEKPEDLEVKAGALRILLDPKTAKSIEGAKIEFVDDMYGGGFKVNNPNQPTWGHPLEQKVQELIDTQINPSLAMHGGHLDLLEVKDDKVFVHFGGGCQGCGMASVTLKQGVEKAILETIPEIKHIIDTTNHAEGENPYFSPGHQH
jgi:Fe/S biogenesis protein NfuA